MEGIIVNHVTKSFKEETVLKDVVLSVPKGKICGIIGRNGSGKTVLFKCICGLLQVDKGDIQVDHRQIGAIIEEPGFLGQYSGRKNLELLASISGKKISNYQKILKMVGLLEAGDKKVRKYSMGMKQRLGIAQAIMEDQNIIILDEPTSGIDPAGVQEFIELIRWLSKEKGLTVLFSSHHLDQVQKVCDRVGLFSNGKILALIDMTELKDKKQELSDIYNHYFEEGGEQHE